MSKLGKEFFQRLFITVIIVTIISTLIWFAFASGMFYLLSIIILSLAILGNREYVQMTRLIADVPGSLMVTASLLIVSSFAISCIETSLLFLPPISLFVSALLFMGFHFRKVEGAVKDISVGFFGVCYIAVPLGMVLSILYFKQGDSFYDGRFWIAYLICVTKISDISAYLVGKLLGKRKLASRISPNKTLEGAVGGFIASVCLSLYFQRIMPDQISFFSALILGILLAIFSQIGDLVESLFKRDVKIKDSGSIPGIGGILDLLDSIFINGVIVYFFLLI